MLGHMSRQRHSFICKSWYGMKESAQFTTDLHAVLHQHGDCASGEHYGFRYKEGLAEASLGVNTL